MPKYSLKTLMIFIFAAGLAVSILVRPSILAATLLMLATVCSLVGLAVLGIRFRRSLPLVVAFSMLSYLVIADGGLISGAERYLPSEWILNQCSHNVSVVDSGRRRADSLTKWMIRLCFEPNHKDLTGISSVHGLTTDSTYNEDTSLSHSDTPVVLPAFTLTKVTKAKIATKRDGPENRAFFIIGHCLVAITIMALAMMFHYQTSTFETSTSIRRS